MWMSVSLFIIFVFHYRHVLPSPPRYHQLYHSIVNYSLRTSPARSAASPPFLMYRFPVPRAGFSTLWDCCQRGKGKVHSTSGRVLSVSTRTSSSWYAWWSVHVKGVCDECMLSASVRWIGLHVDDVRRLFIKACRGTGDGGGGRGGGRSDLWGGINMCLA